MHTGLDTTSLAIELVCDPEPVQRHRLRQRVLRSTSRGSSSTVPPSPSPTSSRRRSPPPAARCSPGVSCVAPSRARSTARTAAACNTPASTSTAPRSPSRQLACDFTQTAPCPASSSNQFSLDTTTLANGPHQIQAAVVDAAGNQTLGGPVQITVDNTAPSELTPPTTPPTAPPPPSPISPSKPAQASPQLRILGVTRTRRALHVRGAAAKTLAGHVTIVVRYTLRGRSHSVQKAVRVANGKWAAVLRLPSGAWTNRVTVFYRGATHWLAQSSDPLRTSPRGTIERSRANEQTR